MDIGRCFNEAIEVYKKNLVQLVLAACILEVLSVLSLFILFGPLAGGWSLMTINALRHPEKRVDLGDLFRTFDQFFGLAGLFFLTFIPILLGLVACVVPGMLLMAIWIFAYFLIVDRKQGVIESLSTSTEIVNRSGLGNYLVLVLIVLAISVGPGAIPYVGIILGWFVLPIAWLVEASAYLQETDEKKPPAKPVVE